jgi:hypothetical protein
MTFLGEPALQQFTHALVIFDHQNLHVSILTGSGYRDWSELRGSHARILNLEAIKVLQFLVWCILFIVCWPIALAALFLYPIVWLLLLPLRIVGIAVGGALALVWALVILPAKVLKAI